MGIKVDMTVGGSAVLASLQRDGKEGGGTRRRKLRFSLVAQLNY